MMKKVRKEKITKWKFLSRFLQHLYAVAEILGIFTIDYIAMALCPCFVLLCCGYHRAVSITKVQVTILNLTHPYIESTTILSDTHSVSDFIQE